MVDVPTPAPVTTPPPVIVATAVVILLQVPPPVASDNVIADVSQKGTFPVIATGCVFTVTICAATQLPIVYDITDVPTALPVTTPPTVIVATVVVPLLHTPPLMASVSAVVKPTQTEGVPVIAAGCVFTVITVVT